MSGRRSSLVSQSTFTSLFLHCLLVLGFIKYSGFLLTEKYDYIGKLLMPGEEPTEYTDDEEVKDKKKD